MRHDPVAWRDHKVILSHHEKGEHKGHTIERHVKISEEQMRERLQEIQQKNSGGFAEISRFKDLKTAEDSITKAIANHKNEIDSWIKHSGPWSRQKELELQLNNVIGDGILK